ncbi:MAG: hypothetical protein ABI723_25740 [Bacteroidia bacterium]
MIKRHLVFQVLICLSSSITIAQNTSNNRKELYDLLYERKQKFDSYSVSLEKRSGIFGNKTKSDIKRSNEVLIEIVKTDNRIISALNRVADFKDFEKVNLTYDAGARNDQLNNLLQATDTLAKQVDLLSASNKQLEIKNQQITWLLYFTSILLSIILFIWLVRKVKASRVNKHLM